MFIKFILALLPILWLMLALSGLKMPGYKACPISLAITLVLALLLWKMPLVDALTGTLEGAAMGIWPICLVIIAAIFHLQPDGTYKKYGFN